MRKLLTSSLFLIVANTAFAQAGTYDLSQARGLVEDIEEMAEGVGQSRAEAEESGESVARLRCLIRNEVAINGFLQLAQQSLSQMELDDAAARNASSGSEADAARESAAQRFELVQISHTRSQALEQLAAQCISATVTAEGEIVRTAEIDPVIDEILAGTYGDIPDAEWIELIDSLIEESSPYL